MQRSRALRLSQTGSMWVNKFRYGFENAPVFGSLHPRATDDHAQRLMYSKALVYASGGSRFARDWLAGCAALSLSDGEIVQVALQHDGTYFDVLALEAHLVQRERVHRASANAEAFSLLHGRIQSTGTGANSSTTDHHNVSASSSSSDPQRHRAEVAAAVASEYDPTYHGNKNHSTSHSNHNSSTLLGQTDTATVYPLTKEESSTIRRCFVYDAVKASSFQSLKLSEVHVAHLEGVCRMLGLHHKPETATSSSTTTNTTSTSDSNTSATTAESHSNGSVSDNEKSIKDKTLWSVRSGQHVVTVCPFLMEVMAIVEEENRLMREKFRVIDQR